MQNKRPLLVVLTPVRNEAWVLPAFLKATSLWADHIIIADQMSTDGSRDIYTQYEKVTVIDNHQLVMHQAKARQLLFEAAKKIEGDKILFALDADEFLSGDFVNTPSWKIILDSEPGDVFSFSWINLLPNKVQYSKTKPLYWAAHLSEDDLVNGKYPDNHIHEWRLPWPENVNHEYIIDDISFIHFANLNVKRQQNKSIFYQVSTAFMEKKYSGVKLFRQYYPYISIIQENVQNVPLNLYSFYNSKKIDLFDYINLDDVGQHYVNVVLSHLSQKKLKHFAKLNIWESDIVKDNLLPNPQTMLDKLIMYYLKSTKKYDKMLVVRMIDFILKKLY